MPSLTLSPPAKLNLTLRILGRMANGYHRLQLNFILTDLSDKLQIEVIPEEQLLFRQTWSDRLALDYSDDDQGFDTSNNLVCKAYSLLRAFILDNPKYLSSNFETLPGASVRLTKNIPAGAGLGGGSSDAAAMLLGLNALWKSHIPTEVLAELALQLGADCPFFMYGKPAIAEGVGNRLSPAPFKEKAYLIVWPRISIATGQIFNHEDLTRNSPESTMAALLQGGYHNDCEAVVRQTSPEVESAFKWLSDYGKPMLTGTGSAVFLAFDLENYQEACTIRRRLPSEMIGFVAKAVNSSPVSRQVLHLEG